MAYQLKPGDVIGFSGASLVSDVVNLCTYGIPRWSISHVGIIAVCARKKLLFEANENTGLLCEIMKDDKAGVQAHKINEVIGKYNGKIWVYPLYRSLYSHEKKRLTDKLVNDIWAEYDTLGAIRSAGVVFSSIESLFRKEDFSSLFCSELVAASLSDIGIWSTANASRWNPNHLVRELRREDVVHKPVRLK